jgi:hypothetical protein
MVRKKKNKKAPVVPQNILKELDKSRETKKQKKSAKPKGIEVMYI